jgi:ATP-dependent DNA ligase
VHSARSIPATRCLIDGEPVCCDDHGISDFARLHSRAHDGAVFLYALADADRKEASAEVTYWPRLK